MFRSNAGNAGNAAPRTNAGTSNRFFSLERVNAPNVLKIILIVIIMISIVGITIWIIDKLKRGSKRQMDLGEEKYLQLDSRKDIPKVISSENLPSPALGNDYTINFWIYLSENYETSTSHKMVMYRGQKDNGATGVVRLEASSPVIVMDKNTNKMHIAVATTRVNSAMSIDEIFQPSSSPRYLTTSIDYVPLQRWVNVSVMILDNVMRVYLDGDIYSVTATSEMRGSPAIITNDEDIVIGTENEAMKIHGFFANLRYFNHSIPQDKIKKIYASGPTYRSWLSMFGFPKYGLQSPIYKMEH